jgi:ABC-2 type transport system permease protein
MDFSIASILMLDGVTNGAIYASLALAIVLVFAVTRVIFIPQGEFVAYGALTLALLQLGRVPGTVWLLLAVVVLTVGVSTLAVGTGSTTDDAKLSLTGVAFGQAVVAILAVLAIGGEYSTGMIHVTFAAMPRRGLVLAAKGLLVALLTAAAGAVSVAGCLVAGRGYLDLPFDGPVRRAALGSVLYLMLIAVLSLGIAALVRDSAAAIGVVLGLLYVLPIVAHAFTDPKWERHLLQIAPMSAGSAIQATVGLKDLPIGPWPGLGVLAAWAAGALVLGGLALRLRDA